MTTERLQLTLIPLMPDPRPKAPPVPVALKADGVELIAMMLVRLVCGRQVSDGHATEVRDESR